MAKEARSLNVAAALSGSEPLIRLRMWCKSAPAMNEDLAERMIAPITAGSVATFSIASIRSAMNVGETTFTVRSGASSVMSTIPVESNS